VWGSIGGYVTLALLVVAAYGFWARRSAIGWFLVAWCVLAILRAFPSGAWIAHLWNLVPGISLTAFARYVQPSWELALVILAAWGIDARARGEGNRGAVLVAACMGLAIAIGGGILYATQIWPDVRGNVQVRNWGAGAWAWALISALACGWLLARRASRAATALAVLLAVDAVLMFTLPTLSTPRAGSVNLAAIQYLRDNLGLQRFYSLGPIQPNYGARFEIASINHNYLPVSRRWVEWIREHLNRAVDDAVFNGARAPGDTDAQELRRNLSEYEWLGVKFVVAPAGKAPLAEAADVRRVYADATIEIFRLPNPKPYFETLEPGCAVLEQDRTRIVLRCDAQATLVRRELFFPGWTATVNGSDAAIADHRGLFQAVALAAGTSEVRYRYAPRHVEWAWLACFVALGILGWSALRRLRKYLNDRRPRRIRWPRPRPVQFQHHDDQRAGRGRAQRAQEHLPQGEELHVAEAAASRRLVELGELALDIVPGSHGR
jgi:hypothetical protein